MSNHECGPDGLGRCLDHPRWNVTRDQPGYPGPWTAFGPGLHGDIKPFPTFDAAINHATAQARAAKVAAIQDGAA